MNEELKKLLAEAPTIDDAEAVHNDDAEIPIAGRLRKKGEGEWLLAVQGDGPGALLISGAVEDVAVSEVLSGGDAPARIVRLWVRPDAEIVVSRRTTPASLARRSATAGVRPFMPRVHAARAPPRRECVWRRPRAGTHARRRGAARRRWSLYQVPV